MDDLKMQFQKAIDFLRKEFAVLQTGRANSKLIEDLEVEAWGAKQPIKHIAGISVPDSQCIVIDPWDKSMLSVIEKMLQQHPNMGFGVKNDGVIIRLSVSALTEERRTEIAKLVHQIAEKARITVRNIRHEEHSKLKKRKEDSEISEDEFFKDEKILQSHVDDVNREIEELTKKKEAEIMKV